MGEKIGGDSIPYRELLVEMRIDNMGSMKRTVRSTESNRLNRYTTLPVMLDIIKRKTIIFSDPTRWEDQNDVELIEEYKRRKHLEQVFLLCFCMESETNLFWSSYAGGLSGCCIEFDRDLLLQSFPQDTAHKKGVFRHHAVTYETRKNVRRVRIDDNDFPFYKRYAYRSEEEYRILWESKLPRKKIEVGIGLRSIRRITINTYMPPELFEVTRQLIISTAGTDIKVTHSTLYRNQEWIEAFKQMGR